MTDQERNERIAEWFEARSTLHELPEHYAVIISYKSPKGFWVATEGFKGWHPLDFFTNETANAILRDAMLAAGCELLLQDGGLGFRRYREAETRWFIKDYKRAIVGAFELFMAANVREGAR